MGRRARGSGGSDGRPAWEDPQHAAYWISRTSCSTDPHVILTLMDRLRRRWPDGLPRRVLLEQMQRRLEELAGRN